MIKLKYKIGILVIIFLALTSLGFIFIKAESKPIYLDPTKSPEERADDLVSKMTLQEKISQMGNNSPAIPRLGIAAYNWWNEALHGIADDAPVTVFPQAIALSSTWDPELIEKIGTAISDEARAKNNINGKGLTYWCPTVNMSRDPRWGRAEESYGEDPYLSSRLAVSFIKGMQGYDERYLKTVATLKHFACNNSEFNRHNGSSDMDLRNLYEYYLPVFKAGVTEGKAYSVMSAYNALNGIPCSANKFLLTDILREKWGFDRYVVTDCDAIYDIFANHKYVSNAKEAVSIAIKAGCDLNCGGIIQKYAEQAVKDGLLNESDINKAVKRLMTARIKLGEFDPPSLVPYKKITASVLDSDEHRNISLEAARKSIVLLKNDNSVLPISINDMPKVAVIGPNADRCVIGGYSGVPSIGITPLSGIREKYGYSSFIIQAENYNEQKGVKKEKCDEGDQSIGFIENNDFIKFSGIDLTDKNVVEVSASSATEGGNIEIRIDSPNGLLISVLEISNTGGWKEWKTFQSDIIRTQGKHDLYFIFKGHSGYLFNIDWFRFSSNLEEVNKFVAYSKGCSINGNLIEEEINDAVNKAKASDFAIVVVGTDKSVADEEHDRESIELPGYQEDLIQKVYSANKNTIVILTTGYPVSINRTQNSVPAIICCWYGGQMQGKAIADAIFGDYNPGGKLTSTWYHSTNDLPPITDYNIRNNRTYMYFEGKTLYPFGFGLSYTSFEYNNLKLSSSTIEKGKSIKVSFDIKNIGNRAGDEIVQFYISDTLSSVKRPIKELKGFKRIRLEPKELKNVEFTLDFKDMGYYDEKKDKFVVEQGNFEILIGSSSEDIRLKNIVYAAYGEIEN